VLNNTIIAAPFESNERMKALVIEDLESASIDELDCDHRLFKIRAANSEGHRSSAGILVSRRYAWRGYSTSNTSLTEDDRRITLVAVGRNETIGTISIGFDGAERLYVDELFEREVDGLRAKGHRVCEFTKLAVDVAVQSKRVLASLFHVAYMYAHRLRDYDRLLIEVNPRHVRYYERMLGFSVLATQRMNRRVNAPAVLMCLDFGHAQQQISRFGGKPGLAAVERSLYPYFFSVSEEAGIAGRLRLGATKGGARSESSPMLAS
jgi:hypothetical protein